MLPLRVMWSLFKSRQMGLLRRLGKSSAELYRMCFLARAGELGLLERIDPDGATLGELAEVLEVGPERRPALEALLDLGVALRECSGLGFLGQFSV